VVGADRDAAAELAQVPADGIDPRGPGAQIPLAQAMERDDRLLTASSKALASARSVLLPSR
jgi:hypothetical protein